MLEELLKCKKVVGLKQCKKAITERKAQRIYVARDAEDRVTVPVIKICDQAAIEVVYVNTMKELGAACCIDVAAAMVAVLK